MLHFGLISVCSLDSVRLTLTRLSSVKPFHRQDLSSRVPPSSVCLSWGDRLLVFWASFRSVRVTPCRTFIQFHICQHTIQLNFNFCESFVLYLCWPTGLSGMTRPRFPLRLCFFIPDWRQIQPESIKKINHKDLKYKVYNRAQSEKCTQRATWYIISDQSKYKRQKQTSSFFINLNL